MTHPPAGGAGWDDFGVYLHIPFCAARCDYCAFVTFTDRDAQQRAYVDACLLELERAAEAGELAPATSCYIGGGTPSRLAPEELARLLEAVELAPGAEVSVECNPESTTSELIDALAGAGVTRISFGAQSFVPHVLAALGRQHTPGSVASAVSLAARGGIASASVDLIYGAVGESDDDWLASLEAMLALEPRPEHVSAYALTVEHGTPLARDLARRPDDDAQARRYELAETVLSDAGFAWYEISNWSLPDKECRHNRLYWRGGAYKGIGCGAHSHLAGRRSWNTASLERYIAALSAGRSPEAGAERLDADSRRLERLALALRTCEGVPFDALEEDEAIEHLVERRDERMVLTLPGRLLANEVALRLRVPPDPAPDTAHHGAA